MNGDDAASGMALLCVVPVVFIIILVVVISFKGGRKQ